MRFFCILISENKLTYLLINCNRIVSTMEHQKTINLLNEASNSKFITRKWNIVSDQSNANYNIGNEIIYSTRVLEILQNTTIAVLLKYLGNFWRSLKIPLIIET